MFWNLVQVGVGLGMLLLAAEALVRGASRLATLLGIPPLIIGLTVVGFGTSAPELAVSVAAAFRGSGDIVFGNVVGSNLFNIAVVLGAAAALRPIDIPPAISRQVRFLESPLLLGGSLVTGLVAWDRVIERWEGLLLTLGLVAYLGWQVREARTGHEPLPAPVLEPPRSPSRPESGPAQRSTWALAGPGLLVLLGLAGLYLGSDWLVEGAVAIASALGVPERVIAVTLIAGGTSLPEVATSVVSALRRQPEIALGNVLGSNLFNIAAVLGIAAAVSPASLPVSDLAVSLDVPVLIAFSATTCLSLCLTRRFGRVRGILVMVAYGLYLAVLTNAIPFR